MNDSLALCAIGEEHSLGDFDCARIPEMDLWLRESALKSHKNRLSRVFVLAGSDSSVLGFFTLSGYCLEVGTLGSNDAKSYKTRHSVPAHYLGRIAVDQTMQGLGVGRLLIGAAFKKYAQILDLTTSNFLCLDAHNAGLAEYYQTYGFKPSPKVAQGPEPIPMYIKSTAVLTAVRSMGAPA